MALSPLENSRFPQTVVLPAEKELRLPIPAGGPRAAYVTLAGPFPAFLAHVGSGTLSNPGSSENLITREVYLGAGGEGESLTLKSVGELKIAQIRWAPLTPAEAKLAAHTKSVLRDKAMTVSTKGILSRPGTLSRCLSTWSVIRPPTQPSWIGVLWFPTWQITRASTWIFMAMITKALG